MVVYFTSDVSKSNIQIKAYGDNIIPVYPNEEIRNLYNRKIMGVDGLSMIYYNYILSYADVTRSKAIDNPVIYFYADDCNNFFVDLFKKFLLHGLDLFKEPVTEIKTI